MAATFGQAVFVLAPLILGGIVLWRFPSCRRFHYRSLLLYVIVMSLLIGGALQVVAYIASAKVIVFEIVLVLWFTIGWRLAWTIWSKTVGRWGQRWVRWARSKRRRGQSVPWLVRLIPPGRATLTLFIFVPAFLSTVMTHRCKLSDGQNPMSVFKIAFESVRIPTADGLVLDGWFIPDKNADRTFLICHGAGANKGNFVWFLGPLARQGYNILFFDFRAHGSSDGRTTTYGIRERQDVLAAVDWLKRERPKEARTIVGLGSSQGAMALALAAAEDTRIDAVILDSPFASPYELAMHHAQRVPILGPLMIDILLAEMSLQTGTNFFAASAQEAITFLGRRPLLVIHGAEDFVMPCAHSQSLYEAAQGPRHIWFGPGPHSNIITTAPYEYASCVFEFLDAHLGPTQRRLSRASTPPRESGQKRR